MTGFITATLISKNTGRLTMMNFFMIVQSFFVEIVYFDEIPEFK